MFIANLILICMYVLIGLMVTYLLVMGIPYCMNLIHDEVEEFRSNRQTDQEKALDEEAIVIFLEDLYSWSKENSDLISAR